MNLTEIATQIKDTKENIVLIYAFNATGKTRLSVEYKNITKANNKGNHSGVCYNAYSEDLFVWDNDENNNNENIKLNIIWSSLNQFHSLLTKEILSEKLELYHPKYNFVFNDYDNPEDGIESITFYIDEEAKTPIKISRGEERIFVWCFFLALFEVDGWADQQDEHIFIDDPVSSLDEHNIFITTDSIFNIIEETYLKKRLIVTTHHIGLFSILADRLTRGEKSGRYKQLTKLFILGSDGNELSLNTPNRNVFLFHLHLMQVLDNAIRTELFVFHFVLLRQLLENISSFLGKGGVNYTLSQIGIADISGKANTINSLSHKDAYRIQFNKMSPNEEALFKEVFKNIQEKYHFSY